MEEHLRELREAGADAALLILRDLDDAAAARLMHAAEELRLDTLVEAHDEEELARATRLGARVIGVNARDLGTFRIDRGAQLELVAKAPRDRVVVAESAIHTRAQAAAAELAGANAVLVGTSLMRAGNPARSCASCSRGRWSRSAGSRARRTSTPRSRRAPTSAASSSPRARRARRRPYSTCPRPR